MSAIWGAIDLNNKNISNDVKHTLRVPFEKCIIDRTEELVSDHVYMGCGIQYFTDEAKYEVLPIHEKETFFFDADVILDNRNELFNLLGLSGKQQNIPDGTIMEKMVKKFGKDALNKMLGAFSFVSYDAKKNEITIAIDAVGNRCVYYMMSEGVFYYSTLLEPLIMVKKDAEINKKWICDFLAMDHLFIFDELEHTPIEGIYRVAPSQVVTVTAEKIEKETFWKPEQIMKDKIKEKIDDETCKKKFRSLYKEAVKCTLRSKDNISVLLSGGYDSTSVACIAANELKKSGRMLYSYTSVPSKKFLDQMGAHGNVDESGDVLKTKEFLKNLSCSFIELTGENPWDAREHQLKQFEFPYKSVQNVLWIEEAMRQAYKNNSRILLTGAYGNTSVSYSNLKLYLQELFYHGHFLKFSRELKNFQSSLGFSRSYAVKEILKSNPHKKKKIRSEDELYRKSYVNREAAEKYGTYERLNKMMQFYDKSSTGYYYDRLTVCDKKSLRQIGEIETKRSLMTGVIQRDPTKDKRILEFCDCLPLEQFVRNNEERRLIYCYLKDIMPPHVLEIIERGQQSADLAFRMKQDWSRIKNEWISKYTDHKGNKLVDCERALNDLNDKKDVSQMKSFDFTRHIYTIMTLEYMDTISTLKTEY